MLAQPAPPSVCMRSQDSVYFWMMWKTIWFHSCSFASRQLSFYHQHIRGHRDRGRGREVESKEQINSSDILISSTLLSSDHIHIYGANVIILISLWLCCLKALTFSKHTLWLKALMLQLFVHFTGMTTHAENPSRDRWKIRKTWHLKDDIERSMTKIWHKNQTVVLTDLYSDVQSVMLLLLRVQRYCRGQLPPAGQVSTSLFPSNTTCCPHTPPCK